MIAQGRWIAAMLTLAVAGMPAQAQVLEPEVFQRKQESQQRARAMTRELLSGVLDLQLQQLEENALTDLEIYRDLELMRGNLHAVVEAEMTNVVELLAAAQKLPQAQREAAFVEARQMIRAVVMTLSAERQNLLRRMKVAELAEQVQRLLLLQSKVQAATQQLPQAAKADQATLALKAVEDQRDVKELFLLLVELLKDVRTWGGTLSNAAADGLKLLQTAGVDQELDSAVQALQDAQFSTAFSHHDEVLHVLRELQKLVLRTQGVTGTEDQSAIHKIQELARQQQTIREETRKLDAADRPSDALVEQQDRVQQELARLENTVRQQAAVEAHREQATAAAGEAAAELFENRPDQAAVEQTKVLGHLAAMEENLKHAASAVNTDQSAAELAKMVQDLEEAQRQLTQVQQQQREAASLAETNAQAAAVSEALKNKGLPGSVKNRLEEAQGALNDLAEDLAAAEPATDSQRRAREDAQSALDRAMAAVNAALEDARRRHAAVEIGELARAAEVLERAAAEEREIAAVVNEISQKSDLNAADKSVPVAVARQAMVTAVAEKVVEALSEMSPEPANRVNGGHQVARNSATALQQVTEAADPSSEPMKQQVMEAAKQAEAAAESFAAAAQELREKIAATAQQLADANSTQANQLQEARTAVEQALKKLGSSPAAGQEQLAEQSKVAEQLADQTSGMDLGTFEALEAARQAAREGTDPAATAEQRTGAGARAQRNIERAAANLATKEQEVLRDQSVANALSDSAREQGAAAQVIAEQRRTAAAAESEPSALEALAAATMEFAEAQQALGQGAVELSKQREVANRPLREALKLASEFQSFSPSRDAQRLAQDEAHGSMPEKREPIPQTEFPKEPGDKFSSDDMPLDRDPLGDADDIVLPVNMRAELGTGFVPKSPEVTAQMMAGPEARAALQAAATARDRAGKAKSAKRNKAKKGAPAESYDPALDPDDFPQEAEGTMTASQLIANQGKATSTDNAAIKDGTLQRQEEGTQVTDSQPGEADDPGHVPALRKTLESAWYAKLPPELRRSIRANAQQRAPRAYEEKLRKYFESVD